MRDSVPDRKYVGTPPPQKYTRDASRMSSPLRLRSSDLLLAGSAQHCALWGTGPASNPPGECCPACLRSGCERPQLAAGLHFR
jgi:hypothetical protein